MALFFFARCQAESGCRKIFCERGVYRAPLVASRALGFQPYTSNESDKCVYSTSTIEPKKRRRRRRYRQRIEYNICKER